MGGLNLKNEFVLIIIVLLFGLLLGGAVSATNVSSTTKISTASYKDLVVSSVNAPAKGIKGSKILVTNTIKNQGNTKITNNFKTNIYLSSTKSLSGSKTCIGSRYISYLTAKAYSNKATALRIPNNVVSGYYYILVVTDVTKKVKESNEKNNYKFSSSKIKIQNPSSTTALPDLIITSIKHVPYKTNGYTIQYTVKNQGTSVSGPCKIYLYTTYNYQTYSVFFPYVNYYQGVLSGTFKIPSLAPGKIYTGISWDSAYPLNAVSAKVDSENKIKESNEKNNQA